MSLLNLAKAQVFCIYKLLKIILDSDNKDFIFTALSIVTLSF